MKFVILKMNQFIFTYLLSSSLVGGAFFIHSSLMLNSFDIELISFVELIKVLLISMTIFSIIFLLFFTPIFLLFYKKKYGLAYYIGASVILSFLISTGILFYRNYSLSSEMLIRGWNVYFYCIIGSVTFSILWKKTADNIRIEP